MAKIGFARAFDEWQELDAAWGAVPEERYTPGAEKIFIRGMDEATETLSQAKVDDSKDGAALLRFMLTDRALCDRPELLRKLLPLLASE